MEINKKRTVERKKKRESRRALMKSDNKPTSAERFDMMNKMLDYQLVYQDQMKGILKSDQYTQWKTMQKSQMTKVRKKGKMMQGKSNHKDNYNGKGYKNGRGSGNKNKNSNN